jgi:hypothetical protein
VKDSSDDEPVTARMGYFTGAHGKEHWGTELVDEHSPLLMDESYDDAEAPSQAEDTHQHQQPTQDHVVVKMIQRLRCNHYTQPKDLHKTKFAHKLKQPSTWKRFPKSKRRLHMPRTFHPHHPR